MQMGLTTFNEIGKMSKLQFARLGIRKCQKFRRTLPEDFQGRPMQIMRNR